MKQRILLGMLVATSLFAKAEFSLSVGTNSFDSGEHLDRATTVGVRGDFYLDNIYHLDVGYDDLGDVTLKKGTIFSQIGIKRYYTQFSADGEEEYHVVPTLSLGLGYEDQSGVFSDSNTYLSLGVGFRYNVSNSFNFLLGTKALWKTSTRDINYHTTFGVGYMLDEEPVNNDQDIAQEVVIPKQKLTIPELHTPKPMPMVREPVVIDSKQAIVQAPTVRSVQTVPTSATLPPPPAMEIEAVSTPRVVSQPQVVQPQVVQPPVQVVQPPVQVVQPQVVQREVAQPQRYSMNGVFIQVAAFSRYRPTAMLDRLVRSGHHVVLRHEGSMTKALVGPYSSLSQAQRALYRVKKIAPRAFIYKGN